MLKNRKSHKSFLILLAIGLTFIINFNKVKAEDDINFKRYMVKEDMKHQLLYVKMDGKYQIMQL